MKTTLRSIALALVASLVAKRVRVFLVFPGCRGFRVSLCQGQKEALSEKPGSAELVAFPQKQGQPGHLGIDQIRDGARNLRKMIEKPMSQGEHRGFTIVVELTRQVNCALVVNSGAPCRL
ncbi:MAG: hypothetical protein KDN05_00865 [Verrucomicrobiae bacterium]|nr:hypothetical protein [Verrucomicrobiae bacterium]